MSTPMYDIPEHVPLGVDENGDGPTPATDPRFDHFTCWCPDGDACTVCQECQGTGEVRSPSGQITTCRECGGTKTR